MTNQELAKKLESVSKMSPPAAAALAAIGAVEKIFKAKLTKANKRIKALRLHVVALQEQLEKAQEIIDEKDADIQDLERSLTREQDRVYDLEHPDEDY